MHPSQTFFTQKKIRFDQFLHNKTQNLLSNSKSVKNIRNINFSSEQYQDIKEDKKSYRISKSYKIIQQPQSREDIFQILMKKIQKVKTQYQAQHHYQEFSLNFSFRNKNKNNFNNAQRSLKKANTQVKFLNFKCQNKENIFEEQFANFNRKEKIQIQPYLQNKKKEKRLEVQCGIDQKFNIKQKNILNQNVLPLKFDYQILQKVQVRQSINIDQKFLVDIKNQCIQQFENQRIQLISISDFEVGKSIGSGKFGEVFICRHKRTNLIFALKKIFKSTICQYKMIDQFINQLKINYTFDHPNIVKMYGHFQDQYHIFLIMEYAPDGCAIDKLNQKKGEKYASQVLYQTLSAMQMIHRKNIVHRDIKPQNIVVFFNNTYKICDFGLSAIVRNQMKHTFCGTSDYVSPQMKQIGQYTFSVDIWSLGILTFQLITGYPPFKDKIGEWKKSGWKKDNFWKWNISYPNNISEQALIFMKCLLKEKPQERSSISECKKSLLIAKYNSQQITIQNQAKIKTLR